VTSNGMTLILNSVKTRLLVRKLYHTHTQCYIYRWLVLENPCNYASKPSVQVSPTAPTSTVTVGVGSTHLSWSRFDTLDVRLNIGPRVDL
jgi:hypothetical protein